MIALGERERERGPRYHRIQFIPLTKEWGHDGSKNKRNVETRVFENVKKKLQTASIGRVLM